MKMLRAMLYTACAAAAVVLSIPAHAQGVIKIGEVNSYKAQPAFLEPYKKGMELAVDEINAAGGVNGKKIELITRDDNANPGDAVRVAEELIAREKVDVLTGTFLSNTGLAVADFAKQKKFFFLAGEPLTDKIIWGSGNKYTYRLRPGTYMQAAMLVWRRPSSIKSAGLWFTPITSTASRRWRRSSSCSRRRNLTWSLLQNRRHHWASSMPAAWCRRWPTPSPMPSSTCCLAPTCPSSCVKAIRAACSRGARWSAC